MYVCAFVYVCVFVRGCLYMVYKNDGLFSYFDFTY